jgi:hypothetical protein
VNLDGGACSPNSGASLECSAAKFRGASEVEGESKAGDTDFGEGDEDDNHADDEVFLGLKRKSLQQISKM